MNPFLKAAILTIIVIALAFLMVKQIDDARQKTLEQTIKNVAFETESNRLLNKYEQVMGEEGLCEIMNSTFWEIAKERTYSLGERIQNYEKSNTFGDQYEQIKREYFVSLTDLYLTEFENKKRCKNFDNKILAFFYSEGTGCTECSAQNSILMSIAPRCPNVRIFAFPVNTDYPFLKLLVSRYNINQTPSIIIEDKIRIEGLQSAEQIISKLKNVGAICD